MTDYLPLIGILVAAYSPLLVIYAARRVLRDIGGIS